MHQQKTITASIRANRTNHQLLFAIVHSQPPYTHHIHTYTHTEPSHSLQTPLLLSTSSTWKHHLRAQCNRKSKFTHSRNTHDATLPRAPMILRTYSISYIHTCTYAFSLEATGSGSLQLQSRERLLRYAKAIKPVYIHTRVCISTSTRGDRASPSLRAAARRAQTV